MLWIALFFTVLQLATACRSPFAFLEHEGIVHSVANWKILHERVIHPFQVVDYKNGVILNAAEPPVFPTQDAATATQVHADGTMLGPPSPEWIQKLTERLREADQAETCEDWWLKPSNRGMFFDCEYHARHPSPHLTFLVHVSSCKLSGAMFRSVDAWKRAMDAMAELSKPPEVVNV